jgi:hypothetical protein
MRTLRIFKQVNGTNFATDATPGSINLSLASLSAKHPDKPTAHLFCLLNEADIPLPEQSKFELVEDIL